MASIFYLARLYKAINRNKWVLYLPLAVYWLALFIGTSLPAPIVPIVFSYNDKVEHLLAFFILSVLLNLALYFSGKSKFSGKNSHIYTAIILFLYGIFDEVHQILIPGRSCEFLDWVADALGVLFGIGLVYLFVKIGLRNGSMEPN